METCCIYGHWLMFVYRIKWNKNIKNISLQKVVYKLYIRIANDCNCPFLNWLLIYGNMYLRLLANVLKGLKKTTICKEHVKKYVMVDRLSVA